MASCSPPPALQTAAASQGSLVGFLSLSEGNRHTVGSRCDGAYHRVGWNGVCLGSLETRCLWPLVVPLLLNRWVSQNRSLHLYGPWLLYWQKASENTCFNYW